MVSRDEPDGITARARWYSAAERDASSGQVGVLLKVLLAPVVMTDPSPGRRTGPAAMRLAPDRYL